MSDRRPDPPRPAVGSRSDPVFEATVSDGVCRLLRPGTRFLSTGFEGGRRVADAAYNVTVPEGFDARDLRAYVAGRLDRAGFDGSVGPDAAPALLTGVDQTHARIARRGPVAVLATAGLSNPAALPVERVGGDTIDPHPDESDGFARTTAGDQHHAGTVNLVAGTTRSLADGALANLLTVVAEAKAATLLALTGFPGTTSDAVVVADDPDGELATFSGSATPVGRATRVCVRDAIAASLRSRYGDESGELTGSEASTGTEDGIPTAVADAEHGVVTDGRATVTSIPEADGDRPL
ncbi:adenosylcobinamide amidohydrolase [Halopenitus persicus]|uniref:Adenosylcobinamide hydrolase n=1 Tax=Halopenitus persicus TaxID=1048396 RepID=A0A1H3G8J0_9EURY|nr:adenosylcobinamide amidohydrolase [Halopenitus persicus]QHS16932.1 adenosylcobinamide amidohydrolase [haloarchaeon 3A1-DGR]SDX99357.1 adenosylcobinamide hydrolase [Halopenitus persicus]